MSSRLEMSVKPVPAAGRLTAASILMNLCVYPAIVVWTLFGIAAFLPTFVVSKLVTGWDRNNFV